MVGEYLPSNAHNFSLTPKFAIFFYPSYFAAQGVNKTHKSNENLCFYYKNPGHFVRNCLKKKNDEKEKANQACEDHEQMFVAALSANDHTMYD
jgi:hypothetical protein